MHISKQFTWWLRERQCERSRKARWLSPMWTNPQTQWSLGKAGVRCGKPPGAHRWQSNKCHLRNQGVRESRVNSPGKAAVPMLSIQKEIKLHSDDSQLLNGNTSRSIGVIAEMSTECTTSLICEKSPQCGSCKWQTSHPIGPLGSDTSFLWQGWVWVLSVGTIWTSA